MISSHIDEARVPSDVINSVGIRSWHVGARKIVSLNQAGRLGGSPFLTAILVVSENFLLLRVHGYDRLFQGKSPLHRCVDVSELCIAVFVICAFFGFAVTL